MKAKRTREETLAECYRRIAEQVAKLSPYDFALFLQRLDRKIYARTVKRTTRTVDGGCVVIDPASFGRRRK